MRIDVVTIFPEMFSHVFNHGVIGKAIEKGLLSFRYHQLRNYTDDKHQTVDDVPFGGGGGLIYKVEPLVRALRDICDSNVRSRSILLSPKGRPLSYDVAKELMKLDQLILFCGRYEGVDARFLEYVDHEISIGDYVLSGGEIAAMVVMDVVCRCVPGVVGEEKAPDQDSFSHGLLEYPAYTRPYEFEGRKVPDILRSGHHQKIEDWRNEQARNITLQRRPDLLENLSFRREVLKNARKITK